MTSRDLARSIQHWVTTYNFCGEVEVARDTDKHIVSFNARTTKTRASTMVTRVRLIVADLAKVPGIVVGKELISEAPENRSALASWRIFVNVPIGKQHK